MFYLWAVGMLKYWLKWWHRNFTHLHVDTHGVKAVVHDVHPAILFCSSFVDFVKLHLWIKKKKLSLPYLDKFPNCVWTNSQTLSRQSLKLYLEQFPNCDWINSQTVSEHIPTLSRQILSYIWTIPKQCFCKFLNFIVSKQSLQLFLDKVHNYV